jgi:hypothetical protein
MNEFHNNYKFIRVGKAHHPISLDKEEEKSQYFLNCLRGGSIAILAILYYCLFPLGGTKHEQVSLARLWSFV